LLNEIPNEQKLNSPNNPMKDQLQESNVREALYASKTGTATSIDNIPYEAWKTLHERHKATLVGKKTEFQHNQDPYNSPK
jgi:hypothetical protein